MEADLTYLTYAGLFTYCLHVSADTVLHILRRFDIAAHSSVKAPLASMRLKYHIYHQVESASILNPDEIKKRQNKASRCYVSQCVCVCVCMRALSLRALVVTLCCVRVAVVLYTAQTNRHSHCTRLSRGTLEGPRWARAWDSRTRNVYTNPRLGQRIAHRSGIWHWPGSDTENGVTGQAERWAWVSGTRHQVVETETLREGFRRGFPDTLTPLDGKVGLGPEGNKGKDSRRTTTVRSVICAQSAPSHDNTPNRRMGTTSQPGLGASDGQCWGGSTAGFAWCPPELSRHVGGQTAGRPREEKLGSRADSTVIRAHVRTK
ncbi:hypothetical protein MAPG_07550 [Magnaporthiopsis poae ATCC 64411]|uniref:Uncharacterized protein n=1 Tax=Magnaporthiopsis poae (strain ATCC 64411 / 73-15) TaxID=644358 RepID=A0A0C4E4Z3_MAGP6|nr:hypothetical protein MAPG_07550 [Magnaporthiopsis poae ATCC 64411]